MMMQLMNLQFCPLVRTIITYKLFKFYWLYSFFIFILKFHFILLKTLELNCKVQFLFWAVNIFLFLFLIVEKKYKLLRLITWELKNYQNSEPRVGFYDGAWNPLADCVIKSRRNKHPRAYNHNLGSSPLRVNYIFEFDGTSVSQILKWSRQ